MARCSKCDAKIYWMTQVSKVFDLKTCSFKIVAVPGAKPNPIDARPHKEGNLVIDIDRAVYRFATGNEKELQRDYGKKLYISHFQTCPEANSFRRPAIKKDPGPSLFE